MRKTILISLLTLVSCNPQNKESINSKYIACYVFDPDTKKECMKTLQFTVEKQGFKEFINKHGLPWESIEDGPVFAEDKQAYLAVCKPKGQYLMCFDYEAKEWQLVKESK